MTTKSESIRDQLEHILQTQDFRNSERLSDFLRFVVEETLAGRADRINQRTVAVNGLGYPGNFNPQTNPGVRVHASLLRRALDRYYLTLGLEDPIRIYLPKGGYVPEFRENRQAYVSQNSEFLPATNASAKSQYDVINGPSIAVLPFQYLGNHDENAYLASGLTEEIVIALTRFLEFIVVGPLSREIIRGQRLDSRGIGLEYNVRFLLDGTVRLRGESLRITVKLTDTRNGSQLWGRAYDFDVRTTTVVKLENEIVGQIVATIADNFGIIPRTLSREILSRQDDSLSDYEAILKFYHHAQVLTEQSLIEAIVALERTVERNPDHDLAIASLADLLATPYWLGYTDDISGLERAELLARRALALNPNLQAARFAMAEFHYLRSHQEQALIEIERVLELNPNSANALAISALFLMGFGQRERSQTLVSKAMRLNPHHPGWYHLIPYLYHYYQGEYEAALPRANRFNTSDYFWDPLIRTAVLGQLAHKGEAEKAAGELLALVPGFASRGRSLIKRMLFLDEHVEMLIEGLHKAGLELE